VKAPGSVVNAANNTITAKIRHFSVYAILGMPSQSLEEAYAYPVPFQPSKGHQNITFANLSATAHIRILTINGDLVRDIDQTDGSGRYVWDVTNQSGQPLASDVYFYVVTSGREKKTGKLVIIR
jgi:hypothetical protein